MKDLDMDLVTDHGTTTTHIIADRFSKRHDHVLGSVNILKSLSEFFFPNFREYQIRTGKPGRPSHGYHVTRDGFCILVMGFTGQRALEWKIKFLEAFNEMERRLNKTEAIPAPYQSHSLYKACAGLSEIIHELGEIEHTNTIRSELMSRIRVSTEPTKDRIRAFHELLTKDLESAVTSQALLKAL